MIKMTIQDTEETAEFKVLEKPIIQKPLIAESDVVTIDNNLSTYVTGTQKRELTVGLGYLDSIGYETLRRIRDRQYAVLKYPTVTITADEPVDMGYGEDVPSYRQRLVQLKGKNLFDKNNTNQIIDDVYINTTANTLDASGGAGTGTIYISCSPQTTYTISKIVSSRFRVGTTSGKPVAGVSVSGIITNDSATKITITTGDNAKYLCVYYRRSQSDSVTKQQLLDSIQIELGPTATTYEPYYDIELRKIGDHQDYIYKSGDKWYVHKAIGKYTFTGSEEGATWDSTIPRIYYTDGTLASLGIFCVYPGSNSVVSDAITTKFVSRTFDQVYTEKKGGFAMSSTGRNWQFSKLGWSQKTDATSDVAGAIAYYALATSTDTEITNETLIAQLDALQNSAFDRWTKVETNVQEPSLQPYLTVTQGEITDSGKEVMLEGTTEDLLDFVILGDTFQQTYSGKNMLNIDVANSSNWGLNFTNNGDGTITVSGTTTHTSGYVFSLATANTRNALKLTSGKTYTQRVEVVSGTKVMDVVPSFKNSGGTITYNYFQDNSTKTPTENLTCNAYDLYVSSLTTGTQVNFTLRIWLEEGSDQSSSFEPYVGGVPSPNTDYPQEVRTVNGSINFDFSGPSGIKEYTMVGKMTLADQRIIDNCGTNEQVQVSFRESKQL